METLTAKQREVAIKHRMLDLGIKGAQIARKLGFDRSAVNAEIRGRRTSRKIREAIADAIGIEYNHLWGEE